MFHILLLLLYVIILALSVRNLRKSTRNPKSPEKDQAGAGRPGGGAGSRVRRQNLPELSVDQTTQQGSKPPGKSQSADTVNGTSVESIGTETFPASDSEPSQGGQHTGGHGGHGGPPPLSVSGDDDDEAGSGNGRGGDVEGNSPTPAGQELSQSSGYGYTRALSRQLRI